MWKATRKEDEFSTPAPDPVAAKPAYTPPPVARPAEPTRAEAPRSVDIATIGKSVIVKGELSGSEDLYVDGEVEGSISLAWPEPDDWTERTGQAPTSKPAMSSCTAVSTATSKPATVSNCARAPRCREIFRPPRVAIEDGAFFKGSIDIQKAEPTPRLEPKSAAVIAAPSPVAAPAEQGSLLEPKKF